MVSAFNVMDTDGSKMIEQAELEKHLQLIGANPTPQQVQEMIKKLDVSGACRVRAPPGVQRFVCFYFYLLIASYDCLGG